MWQHALHERIAAAEGGNYSVLDTDKQELALAKRGPTARGRSLLDAGATLSAGAVGPHTWRPLGRPPEARSDLPGWVRGGSFCHQPLLTSC